MRYLAPNSYGTVDAREMVFIVLEILFFGEDRNGTLAVCGSAAPPRYRLPYSSLLMKNPGGLLYPEMQVGARSFDFWYPNGH